MQSNRPQKNFSQNSSQFKNKKATADNGNQSKQKNRSRKSKDDPDPMETSWSIIIQFIFDEFIWITFEKKGRFICDIRVLLADK